MQIISDEGEVRRATQSFIQHLKKGCRAETARMEWGGPAQESEVFANRRFGYWFAVRETGSGHWFRFGLKGIGPEGFRPVCDLRLPFSGFEPGQEGFLLRFGPDVLIAHAGLAGAVGQDLASFLGQHEYGPTVHEVAAPDAVPLKAVIVSSVSSPDPGLDVLRFVSAVNDYRQWIDQGLISVETGGVPCLVGEPTVGEATFAGTVLAGIREQLAKHVQSRGLGYAISSSPSGGLVLCSGEGSVLAAFQARADLSPDGLYSAIGQLLLPRRHLRAAKFLALPGLLGPYFSQALFRHDIQVVQYKLRDMAVVLDTDEIFAAVHAQ